jgi:hypothetical protein
MTPNAIESLVEMRVLHGNLGATTDFWFLANGNVPDHQIVIVGKDERVELDLSEAEGRPGDLPAVTVLGHFDREVARPDRLRRFIIARCVPHRAIAERAFAIFASKNSGSPEDNWLRAEREALEL